MRDAQRWLGACVVCLFCTGCAVVHRTQIAPRHMALTGAPAQLVLPVPAAQLLPPAANHGAYLVTHGPTQGHVVPYTFAQRDGHWVLVKQGLVEHELIYDRNGAVLIVRETDLHTNRSITYEPPIVLLPRSVDEAIDLSGVSRVVVRHTGTGAVAYRGTCRWHLIYAGSQTINLPARAVDIYHLRLTRELDLAVAQISLLTDFGYAIDVGMVATTAHQTVRVLGVMVLREFWRIEQLL